MTEPVRHDATELQVRAVLESWNDTSPTDEICRRYSISEHTLLAWEAELAAVISEGFGGQQQSGRGQELLRALDSVMSELPVGGRGHQADATYPPPYLDDALARLQQHTIRFEEEYLNVGKIPRNHVWRPYRFCVQDVVLGLVVVRHSLELNCLEVDVCLTSDVPEYEPGSGARMTSAFLFSEAYKCGGTMEIRFTANVEGHRVPASLCDLAESVGVSLNHKRDGRISPEEAKAFYLAISEFSPQLENRIVWMAASGILTPESVCYAVHRGIWSRGEVESILLGSQYPGAIFTGRTLPEQRHLYMHDIVHARAAILGGYLDKKLARRERTEGDRALELEDDERQMQSEFDPSIYGKHYLCDEPMPIPWAVTSLGTESALLPGSVMSVLVRARGADELAAHLADDIDLAQRTVEPFSDTNPRSAFVLVPRDFEQMPLEKQRDFIHMAETRDVGLLVCPETVFSLDAAAESRLSSSRILRQ